MFDAIQLRPGGVVRRVTICLGLGVLGLLLYMINAMLIWAFAHATIARECDHLGGFYVGHEVYSCDRIAAPVKAGERRKGVTL